MGRQAQLQQHRQRSRTEQIGKPAVKRANLNLAATGKQCLIQALQRALQDLLRQVAQSGHVHPALRQFVDECRSVGLGESHQPLLQPFAHFTGCAFGEGDGQNIVGLGDPFTRDWVQPLQQGPNDARNQHPGFAGTGTGFHQHMLARIAGDCIKAFRAHCVIVVLIGQL